MSLDPVAKLHWAILFLGNVIPHELADFPAARPPYLDMGMMDFQVILEKLVFFRAVNAD